MIDEKARDYIESAVMAELEAAIANYGIFHSCHEAWAVLQEEIEEVNEAVELSFKHKAEKNMRDLWDVVRGHASLKGDSLQKLYRIRGGAIKLASECVQVAAMCSKWELFIMPDESRPIPEPATKPELKSEPAIKPTPEPEEKPAEPETGGGRTEARAS